MRIPTLFAAAFFALGLAGPAAAQTPAPPTPDAEVRGAEGRDVYADRSPAWWHALEQQLTASVEAPVEQVWPTTLQNVIYFATQHPERVDLRRAALRLVTVYRQHPDPAVRVLALSALHAVGDADALSRLRRAAVAETNPRVRKVTRAVLAAHFTAPALPQF